MKLEKRLSENKKELNLIMGYLKKRLEGYKLLERYLEWKKENFAKEWAFVSSIVLIAISVTFLVTRIGVPELLGITFLFGFAIFIKLISEYLESWYTTFNKKEIETIKFFKKNGFLK